MQISVYMKRLLVIILAFVLFANLGHAQSSAEIKWVDFEDAIAMQKEKPSKIFLFVYTDWCDYCKYTKETLLKHQPFIDAVNNDFIPVQFNAEQTKEVHFMGHDLGIQEDSGYHYLPIILMEGKMEFPGFLFINEQTQVVSKQNGVKDDVNDFTDYVRYIGSDAYLSTKWLDYNN